MRVYLAGSITGLSFDVGQGWREYAETKLAEHDIYAYSPLRGKEWLKRLEHVDALTVLPEEPMGTPKGIVTRDRWDVQRADVVLMNLLGVDRVSIGTMVELGWADAWGKPVILVIDDVGAIHDHVFVREIPGFRVSDLDVALDLIVRMRGAMG